MDSERVERSDRPGRPYQSVRRTQAAADTRATILSTAMRLFLEQGYGKVTVNDIANATAFCLNASCTQTQPITSPNQLRVPAGALGDFFGPGTTVGIPFAAQLGIRLSF